jgi:hypothetical protein
LRKKDNGKIVRSAEKSGKLFCKPQKIVRNDFSILFAKSKFSKNTIYWKIIPGKFVFSKDTTKMENKCFETEKINRKITEKHEKFSKLFCDK